MLESRRGDWMQTFTGCQFWPLSPNKDDIRLLDIAHSLAHQCRFAGHCTKFYSVAQHSVLVSENVPKEFQKWALLHDAAETYLVDLPRPVKNSSLLGIQYKEIEHKLMLEICVRFGLATEEPACVKIADNKVLMAEKRDLMPLSPAQWSINVEPLSEIIKPWTPIKARERFLSRCRQLGIE